MRKEKAAQHEHQARDRRGTGKRQDPGIVDGQESEQDRRQQYVKQQLQQPHHGLAAPVQQRLQGLSLRA